MKRIAAMIGIILLVGLYLSTLIFALMDSEFTFTLFKASILMTIAVPCLLYAMILIYNFLNKKK
ncbi:MAG: hypothetical protein SO181_08025 [Frisingicoccus sp.]|uniref:hypothetical protein n=1 Tax=Frisingicoccus sp. TaxID=1918627 RepID=UPI002A83FE55|nr:hypothetical protein [Frisingicoccus sp.]MDY4835072.1 hypothetical protein [Frisingicoccus sp.]